MFAVCSERDALATSHKRRVPILLKISPDLSRSAIQDIVSVVEATRVDGIIATNTSVSRGGLQSADARQEGGLSGVPLFPLAIDVVRTISLLTERRLPIIGIGGIFSGAEAYEMVKAGASLVQIHTGLVYRGPALVQRMKRELVELLRQDGFTSIGQAVGISAMGTAPATENRTPEPVAQTTA